MKKQILILLLILLVNSCTIENEPTKRDLLLNAIGVVDRPADLKVDTLETKELDNGIRYKIEYNVTDDDTIFGFEEERVRAYLFIPENEKNAKLPAVIAIHQYGMEKREWGKMETAGIIGDSTMFYGLELFNRGYVVICPDNMLFGERAYRLSERAKEFKSWDDEICDTNATKEMDWMYMFLALYGPTMVKGQTLTALLSSDLSCAVDILENHPNVDKNRIGAIGHSGGGESLIPFMLVDTRIKAGISSCGFSNQEQKYFKDSDAFGDFGAAIFGIMNVGGSRELIAQIAPRALYFTKGKWEYGSWGDKDKKNSAHHVKDMTDMVDYAKEEYKKYGAEDQILVDVFEENYGKHSFPDTVKMKAYEWLDKQLKNN